MTLAPETLSAIEAHGRPAMIRAMQHALWRQGDLSWLLHDGVAPRNRGQSQAEAVFLDAQARGIRRTVDAIGRRWGKSHRFCVKACETALGGPRRRIPYAAMSAVSLRQFVLPIMRKVIETAPDDVRPILVGTEVRFSNGSVIVMQGCEDRVKADRLRGPEAHLAIVDEAGFLPSEILDYVVGSVLAWQLVTTDGMMMVGSSPPETPDHEFARLFAEAETVGAAFHATIYDAPHVTPEAVEKVAAGYVGGKSSVKFRREALAQFLVDPVRALVPEFSEQLELDEEMARDPAWLPIVREVERPEHFHAYTVGDLGYVDLTAILGAYWHFTLGCVVIEDEIITEKATSDIIQRKAAEMERRLWSGSGIVGEPTRVIDAPRITVADLSRLHAGEKGPEGAMDDAWTPAWVGELTAGVNQLRVDVGQRRVIVHPRCVTTIRHLKSAIWNKQRTSAERSPGMGHFDAAMACVYLCRTVDRTRNPYPMARPSNVGAWVPPQPKPGSEWGHMKRQRR